MLLKNTQRYVQKQLNSFKFEFIGFFLKRLILFLTTFEEVGPILFLPVVYIFLSNLTASIYFYIRYIYIWILKSPETIKQVLNVQTKKNEILFNLLAVWNHHSIYSADIFHPPGGLIQLNLAGPCYLNLQPLRLMIQSTSHEPGRWKKRFNVNMGRVADQLNSFHVYQPTQSTPWAVNILICILITSETSGGYFPITVQK